MANFAALDRLIASQHPSHETAASYLAYIGAPSVTMAVLSDGKISPHIITSTEKDDVDTLFQAGSISKPITALAVMRLVDQGKINLEDSVTKYLPDDVLDSIAGDERTRAMLEYVTIELLLCHKSGLGVHGFEGYAASDNHENGAINGNGKRKLNSGHPYRPSAAEIITGYPRGQINSRRVALEWFPGEKFSYSGGGYTVLQLILEIVGQKSFPALLKELVLDPLGMNQSTYEFASKWEGQGIFRRSEAYSTGYTKALFPYHDMSELAAAGLWTTPSDLLKAVKGVQESLEKEEGGFLTQQTARKMLTPMDFDGNKVGLGWMIDDYGFGHSGYNDPGWISFLWAAADMSFWKNKKDEEKEKEEQKDKTDDKEKKTDEEKAKEEAKVRREKEYKESERKLEEKTTKNLAGRARCVMTNAVSGFHSIRMIQPALTQVAGWPVEPPTKGGMEEITATFADGEKKVDGSWKEWVGKWGEKEDWAIEDIEGRPHLRFKALPPMKLHPAARQVHEYPGGETAIDLKVDGLGMQNMVRLGWKRGEDSKIERSVEVWTFDGKEDLKKKKEKKDEKDDDKA